MSSSISETVISSVAIDNALQARETLDEPTVAEYTRIAKETADEGKPWPFPPIQVVGGYLVDGFHRLKAAKRSGRETIPADEQPGSRQDAIQAAVSANARHGLPRSNADKRRAVEMALKTWPDFSSRQIAKACKVSHTFVNQVREAKLQPKVETFPPCELPPQGDQHEVVDDVGNFRSHGHAYSDPATVDSPGFTPISESKADPPKVETFPPCEDRSDNDIEQASEAQVTKRVTPLDDDPRIHARKAKAALESALRHAGDFKDALGRPPDGYQRASAKLEQIWNIYCDWSRDPRLSAKNQAALSAPLSPGSRVAENEIIEVTL